MNNTVVANQNDFPMKICTFKTAVKKILLLRQSDHDADNWCPKNYDIPYYTKVVRHLIHPHLSCTTLNSYDFKLLS